MGGTKSGRGGQSQGEGTKPGEGDKVQGEVDKVRGVGQSPGGGGHLAQAACTVYCTATRCLPERAFAESAHTTVRGENHPQLVSSSKTRR